MLTLTSGANWAQKSAEDDSEANRHTMLRPRQWWEAKFAKQGAVVNRELLWAMQEKDTGCASVTEHVLAGQNTDTCRASLEPQSVKVLGQNQ